MFDMQEILLVVKN